MTDKPALITPLTLMDADADGMCGPDGCLLPASHPAMTDAAVTDAETEVASTDAAEPAAE